MNDKIAIVRFSELIERSVKLPVPVAAPWLKRRSLFVVQEFADRLGKLIEKYFGFAVALSLNTSELPIEFEDRPSACIELRAYQQPVLLILPPELLSDLLAVLNKKPLMPLTAEPEDRTLALISYFVARLLGAEELFGIHRVLLSGFQKLDGAAKVQEAVNGLQLLTVTVKAFRSEFDVFAAFPEKLCERIDHYATLYLQSDSHREILKRAKTLCELRLELRLNRFTNLLLLQPGDWISLGEETSATARLSLGGMQAAHDSFSLCLRGNTENGQLLLQKLSSAYT